MVFTQSYRLTISAQHWPGVTSVSYNVVLFGNKYNISCASHSRSNEFLLMLVDWLQFIVANDSKLVLPLGRLQDLINVFECLIKCFLKVFILIWFEFSELSNKNFADILADFKPWVSSYLPPCPSKTANRPIPSPMFD